MPGTVIDALVIQLGLDSSGFKSGQKQAEQDLRRTKESAHQSAKEIDASGEVAARYFTRMRNEALALFAVFTAGRGLKDFIRDITLTDAATGRLAENIGISTSDLAAWEGAAERAGGSVQGIAGSMLGLTQAFQQLALTGHSEVVQVLGQLGIKATDAAGHLKPVGEMMLEIADLFSKMSMPQAQAEGKMLGFDAGTIQLLHQGRAEVERLLAAQRQLGVPNGADAKRAQTLINDLKDLQQTVFDVARRTLNDVSPQLDKILKRLEQWLLGVAPQIKATVKEWVDWLSNLDWGAIGEKIATFAGEVSDVVTELGGWKTIGEAILALYAVSRLAAIAGGFNAIGAALANPVVLAAIAAWTAFYIAYQRMKTPQSQGEMDRQMTNMPPDSPLWRDIPNEQQLKYGNSPAAMDRDHPGWRASPFMQWLHQPSTTTTAEQAARSKQAIDYFTQQGWTAEQAAGIAGNLQQESSFDPRAANAGHVGIVQWDPTRAAAIERQFGKPVSAMSYQEQLAALQWEITQGPQAAAGRQLRLAQTTAQAARVVDEAVEKPGNYDVENPRRIANAEARLRAWQGGALSGAPAVAANNNTVNHHSTSREVNVGQVTVNTRATDGKGIARSIRGGLQDAFMVHQANSGLA